MEEKKFVSFKKEELGVKEYVKNSLGKGRISNVSMEYTPVGEKIIIATSKPGLVIGRGGEKIEELTTVLKKRFKLDNPHIEIKEITEPYLDAQLVADEIAVLLERQGSSKYKVVAYRMLKRIMDSGALGAEIILSGKLPSDRSRSWRFTQGYLQKTGFTAKVVEKAQAQAKTIPGIAGIKVSILPPSAELHDRIVVDEEMRRKIKVTVEEIEEEKEQMKSKKKTKKTEKKVKTSKKTSSKTKKTGGKK
jgi:small subunit ribosomal protein S3